MKYQLAKFWFWITGWKIEGGIPGTIKKCVLVAAPHTSNWDFPFALAGLYLMNVDVKFLAKKSLFNFPLGWIMYGTGGIPVDRAKNTNMVERMIQMFSQNNNLILLIPAEGTRGKVSEWKSGFYHTAVGANVPIALGFLDYKRKIAGITQFYYPTGNFESDLPEIKSFYKNITARYPEKASV
jgi:1-acyl-sn-glycerol-3-phosphate acyltransferase